MIRNIVLTVKGSSDSSNIDYDSESIELAKIEKWEYFEDGGFKSISKCFKKIKSDRMTPSQHDSKKTCDKEL